MEYVDKSHCSECLCLDPNPDWTTHFETKKITLQKPHELYEYEYGLKDNVTMELMRMQDFPDVYRKQKDHATINEHYYTMYNCRHYIGNEFARVIIKMKGSSYLKRVQTLKYSEAEKFTMVGGTLGLLTGFSFIVVFELLYWIVITFKKACIVVPTSQNTVQPLVASDKSKKSDKGKNDLQLQDA